MEIRIHGDVSDIERMAINAALNIHDKSKKGFRINHRVKIKNTIPSNKTAVKANCQLYPLPITIV